MWPLNRNTRGVVRLCRNHAELWANGTGGLVLVARQEVPLEASGRVLCDSLVALLDRDEVAGRPMSEEFDAVVESAWLPVLPLQAGTALWSASQMDALLRHRAAQTYAGENDALDKWLHRLDYRPGDSHGIGYAMTPDVSNAVAQAASAVRRSVRSLQPAFSWGWQALDAQRRRATRSKTFSCWMWLEHDRALLALLERGRIIALNPGVDLPLDENDLMRQVEVEVMRAGSVAKDLEMIVGGWRVEMTRGRRSLVTCLSVASDALSSMVPLRTAPTAGGLAS